MFKLYTEIYIHITYIYMLYIHIHLYTYTHNTYIYTVLYMYIWPFIEGPWILLSTSSLTKLCEGGSFILHTLMPILNSFFCCFLLTLHISVRGSSGSGNNHSSLIARHQVDVALYLTLLSITEQPYQHEFSLY